MKKILFFIPTLGGGGAEKVLINLVNNLSKEKYDITVQTLFDIGINKRFLSNDIKYISVFKKRVRGNIHFLKLFNREFLFKKMIKDQYDIIISYLEGPTTRIVSGCTNPNTKLINWVHTEMRNLKEFKSSYRSEKEMKKTYEKYDMTIFVAESTRENFMKFTGFKLKQEKVIRNIIDIKDIIIRANETNEEEKRRLTLVTLARLTQSKGYDRLLRIHKRLLDEGIEQDLWILGEGEERKKIEEFVKENSLYESVKLYGYKENPYKYLKQADIYVCASYIEGYSTAVTEAIIIGKPVVTTNCSGMHELLENGKYGLIVENKEEALYNGIKKMILNKEIREQYEKLSLVRRKYFEIEKQLQQINEILS